MERGVARPELIPENQEETLARTAIANNHGRRKGRRRRNPGREVDEFAEKRETVSTKHLPARFFEILTDTTRQCLPAHEFSTTRCILLMVVKERRKKERERERR